MRYSCGGSPRRLCLGAPWWPCCSPFPARPQTCLHSVQLQVEAVQRLEPLWRLHILGLTQHADVHRHLEVVLLLAHKSVVTHRKVEALVGVHPVGEHRPRGGEGDGGQDSPVVPQATHGIVLPPTGPVPTPLLILCPPKSLKPPRSPVPFSPGN